MYSRVLAVTHQARRLYTADDTVSGISPNKFAGIMFHDACFLLQYMHLASHLEDSRRPSPLQRFFLSNLSCINNDIVLLENQLPWLVMEANDRHGGKLGRLHCIDGRFNEQQLFLCLFL